MAITTAMANSLKSDFFAGTHVAADVYKIALYTSAATLDATTTAYSATNEAVGTGYTAGGQTLVGYTPGASGGVSWVDFTTDPSWAASTITARGAMIYNSSKSNKCLGVWDFGADKVSSGGAFDLTFPAAAAATALIRVGP